MLAYLMMWTIAAEPPEPTGVAGPPEGPVGIVDAAPMDPETIPPNGDFWIVSGAVVTGSSLLWGGSFALAHGYAGTGGVSGPPTPEEVERRDAMHLRSGVAIGVNAGFFVMGLGAIAYGAVQEHRFGLWRRDSGYLPPQNGGGLLGAGTGVLVAGAGFVGSTGPFFLYDSFPEDKAMFGVLGAAYAVVGTALIIGGAIKRKRVNARLRSNYELSVRPVAPGHFQFGLARAAM